MVHSTPCVRAEAAPAMVMMRDEIRWSGRNWTGGPGGVVGTGMGGLVGWWSGGVVGTGLAPRIG